jgi:hypothetical protein
MNKLLKLPPCLLTFVALGFSLAQGVMTFSPNHGPVGTHVRASASGLKAGTSYDFVWFSAKPQWLFEDGHFNGLKAPETQRVLTHVTTDASGQATFSFTVPEDYGFVHNTALRLNGQEIAKQGFTISPKLTISPTSGPLGTPITVTVTGLGYSFYHRGWQLMYDNHQTGWVTGVTTHGSATFTIPATGDTGPHLLQLLSGPRRPYLNIEQSPSYQPAIAYHQHGVFTITPGQAVTPPDAAGQTLTRTPGEQPDGSAPAIFADFTSGTVGSPIHLQGVHFPADAEVTLSYTTVRGNRISGKGWDTAEVPWGSVQTDASGSFSVTKPTPDDLEGPRTITARAGQVNASMGYTITPSVDSFGPAKVAPGGVLKLVLKGTGWSDTGNIYTVVMDNSYFGYACGFNTHGTIIINFTAPVRPGWHYLDLYPSIYEGESGAPTKTTSNDHFQLPMLHAVDHPGERLPVFHLAFKVVD